MSESQAGIIGKKLGSSYLESGVNSFAHFSTKIPIFKYTKAQ